MLSNEFGRSFLGLQNPEHNKEEKERYEFDQNNFFIVIFGQYGSRDCHWRLLINPEIKFEYLNIIEISYVKDDEKIYLLENWKYKYFGFIFTIPPVLKYKNYPKYFKNMDADDEVIVTILQVYQFDNGPIITEEALYKLICWEEEYNPLTKYIPNY
jgi:hypothetical protein